MADRPHTCADKAATIISAEHGVEYARAVEAWALLLLSSGVLVTFSTAENSLKEALNSSLVAVQSIIVRPFFEKFGVPASETLKDLKAMTLALSEDLL